MMFIHFYYIKGIIIVIISTCAKLFERLTSLFLSFRRWRWNIDFCMKLAKSQEKKVNVNTRGKEGMEIRIFNILFLHHWLDPVLQLDAALAEMLSHNEGEVQMWNNWNLFQKIRLWTYVDFQIDQTDCGIKLFPLHSPPPSQVFFVQIWISHNHG